jgi:hypothetical protein
MQAYAAFIVSQHLEDLRADAIRRRAARRPSPSLAQRFGAAVRAFRAPATAGIGATRPTAANA